MKTKPKKKTEKRKRFVCSGKRGTLWFICQHDYFPRRLRIRSDNTMRQYQYSLNDFGGFLGREPMPKDLNDDALAEWAKDLEMRDGLSTYTVREKLGRVLALWNWLARRRVVEQFPTVERPEGPEIVPTALTQEQLSSLFEEAAHEHGEIEGIKARDWWRCFLAFVWATGERKGATLALRWDWVYLDRKQVVIPANARKGRRKAAVYAIWDELLPLLRRIAKPARELVFPWPYSEGCFYDRFGRLMVRAGLPDDRKHKTHSLRVSHATWLKVLGGDPTAALLHGDAATTRKHYLDPRLMPAQERKLFAPWNPAAGDGHKTADWL